MNIHFINLVSWNYFSEKISRLSASNRMIAIAIVIIGVFGAAYVVLRFIDFQAKKQKNAAETLFELFKSTPFSQPNALNQNEAEDNDLEEMIHESFNDSLTTLKKGYAIIPFLPQETMQDLFNDVKNFDLQAESYKEQFIIKNQIEIGYSALKNKKVFVVRNQEIPQELNPFISYFSTVHTIAMDILKFIEKDLDLSQDQLTQTVAATPLPDSEDSISLLRLFAYDPSLEEGMGAEAHEDLGLLTVIPCSQVPALEVMDYQKEYKWVNVEKLADATHAVVLVGRTLEQMTKGKYQAALHRVKQCPDKRFSIVYQMRAEPSAQISTKNGSTTVGEWMKELKKNLKSVNGSY